ncbi:MAG: TSUP family transporter, partial [Clostridia bacterium]
KLRDQQQFRITLSLIWAVLNLIYACIAFQAGHFTGDVVEIILMCIPAAIVAMWLGNRLQKKISREKFLKLTYVLLLFVGVVLLITS